MDLNRDGKAIYIFIDEAGDLNFSNTGTEYFILSSLTTERPFPGYNELIELKYNLVEFGFDIESFHVSEDSQPIRDRVFKTIYRNLSGYRIDSLIVKKRKIAPALQDGVRFYPEMVGYLLQYVLDDLNLNRYSEIIVFYLPIQFP